MRAHELNAVRSQADSWRNGLGALIGITTTAAAFAGPADVKALALTPRVLVAMLLLLGIISSTTGGCLAMRAAHGFPARRQAEVTLDGLLALEQVRLRRACSDLRLTVFLALFSLAMVVAAIGVVWFG